jgi:hypothetical protein
MQKEKIKDLTDRYFEGQTSQEEEQELRAYIRTCEVGTPEIKQLKVIFGYFEAEKQVKMPQATKSIGSKRSLYQYAAAASIVLLMASGFWFVHAQQAQESRRMAARERLYNDHFDNPEQALTEVKAALALVGRKMQKAEKMTTKNLKNVKHLGILK